MTDILTTVKQAITDESLDLTTAEGRAEARMIADNVTSMADAETKDEVDVMLTEWFRVENAKSDEDRWLIFAGYALTGVATMAPPVAAQRAAECADQMMKQWAVRWGDDAA